MVHDAVFGVSCVVRHVRLVRVRYNQLHGSRQLLQHNLTFHGRVDEGVSTPHLPGLLKNNKCGLVYDTIPVMGKMQKLIARMRNNPRDDWSIDELKALAERKGIDWRQPGTSHVTFSYPGIAPLTVPAHKPVKAVYVKRFLDLMALTEKDDND